MQFKRLHTNFLAKTKNLPEVLQDKGRGYCVAEVAYKGIHFAVPLRSNLETDGKKPLKIGGAKTSFITDKAYDPERGMDCYRGLDYQKSLLLNDKDTDLTGNYPLPDNNQKTILNDNEYKISKDFIRYVDSYIRAHKRNLPFKNSFFKSTLVNYHKELGI